MSRHPTSQTSMEHRLRALLDKPLRKKGFFFLLLSPFFLLISVCWWILAKIRSEKRKKNAPQDSEPRLVCVGNILVGGSGKSPVVRELARVLYQRGFHVAIISRDFKKAKSIQDVTFVASSQHSDEWKSLGDEAREHFLMLTNETPKGLFFFLQSHDRLKALRSLKHYFLANNLHMSSLICLFDDGLQSPKAAAHADVCVWDPQLLKSSPPFCIPLGPYREGFLWDFPALLKRARVRMWSRARHEERSQFESEILSALRRFGAADYEQNDFLVSYGLSVRQITTVGGTHCIPRFSSENEALSSLSSVKPQSIAILSGIAQPLRFNDDVLKLLGNIKLRPSIFSCMLQDHGHLTLDALAIIEKAECCFLTGKDFARFCTDERFQKAVVGKLVYVCFLDVKIGNLHPAGADLVELLLT